MTASTRRRRERIERADGTEAVQTKPPRADLLTYPNGWPTVLVRRTHDVEKARELAAARWAELGDERPLEHHRVGWWRTTMTSRRSDGAATDEQGRVVQWCDDTEHAAGPGVEFRP